MTFREAAEAFAGSFEQAERSDGETFIRLRSGSPTWMTDIVRAAHGEMLPDDWRYACIAAAAEHIAQYDSEDEAQDADGPFADGQVDVYTSDRYDWLSSHGYRSGYCDEAREEYGYSPAEAMTIEDQIALGQYYEASEVYGLVLHHLARLTLYGCAR